MNKLLLLLIFSILLVAPLVSAWEWDNVKSYDINTKTVTIKNALGLGSDIVKATLDTPQDYKVGAGYGLVAQFTINPKQDYDLILKSFEFYDLRKGGKVTDKQIDIKYQTIEKVEVVDYIKSFEILKNGTQIPIQIKAGSHYEDKIIWKDFDNNVMSDIPMIIGLFTDVQVNDKIEWIPTIAGVKVNEWAVWTASLNVDLLHYYTYEYVNSTWTGTNNSITGNWDMRITNNSVGAGLVAGILGNALLTKGDGNYSTIINVSNLNNSYSVNFWANHTWVGASNNILYEPDTIIGGSDSDFVLNNIGNGTICFNGANSICSNITVVNNTINMYTITSNETWFWFYVNGTLARSIPKLLISVADMSAKYLDMPRRDVMGQGVWYDEFGYWNRTITSAEVTQLWNGGTGMTFLPGGTASITLINPADAETFLTSSITFATLPNSTVDLTNLNVTIYTNATGGWTINATNTSAYNNTQTNFTSLFPEGVYLWNAMVNDSSNVNAFGTNRTFVISKIVYLNQSSYDNQTFEKTSTTFKQNFTIATGYSATAVNLTYNQTNYSASFSSINASSYQTTITLTTPEVNTNTNITFNWTVVLNDGSLHISSSHLQLVNNFGVDNCSNNTIQIINLTLVDEDLQNILNATTYNTSIKVDLNLYSDPSRSNLVLQYSHLFNQTNTSRICMNSSLGSSILYEDAQIEYSAGIYADEFYYIQNYSLNATSNPLENITLYDLLSDRSQIFTINVKDSSYLALKDAVIEIHRKYIDEGVYKIIELPYTDGTGTTLAHLVTNDAIYNFIIKKYGVTIASVLEKRAGCQNPTLTECIINLNAFATGITVPDYQTLGDFNFTLDYNESARTISSTFLIPSGTISTVLLNVTREDALGTAVCTDTIISAGGTLTCIIPANFGNASVVATLYKDSNFVAKGGIKLDQNPSDIYGGTLVILSLFIILTLIGAAMSDNPIYTIIFFMSGVILVFALNLVKNNGFIGATATILWLIVAIVIVIIKGSNRS
jgi:hypothetical protein